ncbi:MAG: S4 domain-containing protein, partial [Terriglobales bacterium]
MEERLQKIVAQAGIASRRKVEEMILAGRVSVNGEIVSVLGAKADPARDTIAVDGKRVAQPERLSYWLFHKPRQVVSTLSDPEHRPSLADYLRAFKERLYPVGRLDYHSEG